MEMITGIITISIFLVVQLIAAVYWAGTINTKMDFMVEASKVYKDIPLIYSTKAEVQTALSVADKNIVAALTIANRDITAMWKQIDSIKEKFDNLK